MNIRKRKARWKTQNKTKNNQEKANYALQHVKTGSWCMVDEERLEPFMTKVPVTQISVQQINGLVSIRQEPPS